MLTAEPRLNFGADPMRSDLALPPAVMLTAEPRLNFGTDPMRSDLALPPVVVLTVELRSNFGYVVEPFDCLRIPCEGPVLPTRTACSRSMTGAETGHSD